MGDLAVTPRVQARDQFGRFRSELQRAADQTMAQVAEDGKDLAIAFAPVGSKHDPRGPSIVEGMFADAGGHTARWGTTSPWGIWQEKGGARHEQTGDVSFFWEREGRDWRPGRNMIDHPGNPPHPYLKPSYDAIMGRIMDIARKFYPG